MSLRVTTTQFNLGALAKITVRVLLVLPCLDH